MKSIKLNTPGQNYLLSLVILVSPESPENSPEAQVLKLCDIETGKMLFTVHHAERDEYGRQRENSSDPF